MKKRKSMKMDLNSLTNWVSTTPALFHHKGVVAAQHPFMQDIPQLKEGYAGNPRLGFIYQHLCSLLFKLDPTYSAVSEEIQLNDSGTTLGALDFVVKNKRQQRYEHWEVAIKFYLLHQGLWYGPNSQDRLDIKLDHMLHQQLTLSQSESFQTTYPLWRDISHHLLMQGRLYTNPFANETIPEQCLGYSINSSQIAGYWCYQSQAEQINEALFLLDKPQWISGKSTTSPVFTSAPEQGFVHCQSESGRFWFIVPDQWPHQSV
ncbi:DUF1853 family protein [Vibrio aestuarianus]